MKNGIAEQNMEIEELKEKIRKFPYIYIYMVPESTGVNCSNFGQKLELRSEI